MTRDPSCMCDLYGHCYVCEPQRESEHSRTFDKISTGPVSEPTTLSPSRPDAHSDGDAGPLGGRSRVDTVTAGPVEQPVEAS